MDFAASLVELQAEASCPLCLDYLKDPVTTSCGHNFCRSCIQLRWEDLQDIFPCPVCLYHCPDRNFKKNTQLCHITDIVKQIPTTGRERELQEEKPLCVKHHEVLTLFCEEDLELLCPQCSVSLDYEDRPLIPIEEAAASYRKRLKNYLEALTVEIEDAEMGFENQVANIFKVQKKMESCRRELLYECKEFKNSLKAEQDEINASLLVEEKDVKEKLTENRGQISNHMLMLNNLLIEVVGKYFQTDKDLLTDIESIHKRYENLATPAVFSYELKNESCILPPHYFGLHKMISTFQEDLALDPETAHPSLIISRDRKSMTYKAPSDLSDSQVRPSYPAVLSSEGFDAGRHYWQVDIAGTGEWSLGICKESFLRNAFIALSPNSSYWNIELCAVVCGTCRRGHVVQVGIFLDYELGEISFYNMNNRSYLYKFCETFTDKLMPYFSSAPSSKSLTISIIRDK
ncbi:tripartite motif-containing protein 60-like [Glossophaga mutica]